MLTCIRLVPGPTSSIHLGNTVLGLVRTDALFVLVDHVFVLSVTGMVSMCVLDSETVLATTQAYL